jgi:hypothetical protein
MDKATIHKELRGWFEWTKDNVKSMITQIIKAKEFTALLNKITSKNKKIFQKDIDTIVNKAIDKEIEYYITKHKITSKEEYADILDKLSKEEILKIKTKCCNDVLEEMSS